MTSVEAQGDRRNLSRTHECAALNEGSTEFGFKRVSTFKPHPPQFCRLIIIGV
jgi:hypothetical protein